MATPRARLPSVPRLPEPLLAVLRALGLPVSAIARYWAQESRSIANGSSALGVGLLATLIAGTVLGAARDELAAHPGLLVLIPAAIGMRGSIFGALAARLSTGMLTGEFEPQLTRRSFLGRQIEAVTILSITTATEAGALAWLIATVVGLGPIALLDLIAISLIAGILSSLVLVVVTVQMARVADRRGWNMDDVGAPVITATGDLITLPVLLLATLLLDVEPIALTFGALGVVGAAFTLWRGWRHEQPTIRRVVRESLIVLTIAVILQVLAGVVLQGREEQLVQDFPALLVLVPAFVATCGSLGGMLASRFASKLHIGLLEPRLLPGTTAGLDISLTFLLATVAYTGVGTIGWLAADLAIGSAPPLLTMVSIALLGGLLATILLAVVAYGAATATFRFGLDPDNHGIPVVTATMDFLGILCLVAAATLT